MSGVEYSWNTAGTLNKTKHFCSASLLHEVWNRTESMNFQARFSKIWIEWIISEIYFILKNVIKGDAILP